MSLRSTLSFSINLLLSPLATSSSHSRALSDISRLLADLTLPLPSNASPPNLDAFLTLQDTFDYNLASILLEWLGRVVTALKKPTTTEDVDLRTRLEVDSNLTMSLGLLQGLLLLHRKSQRLFARSSTLEIMIVILDHTRASSSLHPASASSPLLDASTAPSPVLFPPSPVSGSHSRTRSASSTSSTSMKDPAALLALAALDTLLCALVDRPKNMRAFEEVGGLKAIVGVLKDKNVGQVVRIKAIEILFYYLLPEEPIPTKFSSRPIPPLQQLTSAATDFVPQTPLKDRFGLSPSRARSRSSSSLIEGSENEAPPKLLFPHLSSSNSTPKGKLSSSSTSKEAFSTPISRKKTLMLEEEDNDLTPKASHFSAVKVGPPASAGRRRPPSPTPTTSSRSSSNSSSSSSSCRRTEEEKREILRKVMPNVEALESKFRAMGLMPGV